MSNIKIENLSVKFESKKKPTVVALDNVSLDIKDATLNVIVGYSGCGKTTLLRSIAGLQEYEGYIYFDGVDGDTLSVQQRNVSMVTQNYVLYRTMTVFENIAFPLTIAGASKEEIIERVYYVAERLGIKHCLSRKPKHLSGGQQQKVALARALIKKPDIYLFDEPFSNVDPQKRYEERIFIKRLMTKYHATVIYVTHDIQEALALADTIFIMDNGKIVMQGDPKTIFDSDNELITSYKKMIYEEKAIKG